MAAGFWHLGNFLKTNKTYISNELHKKENAKISTVWFCISKFVFLLYSKQMIEN